MPNEKALEVEAALQQLRDLVTCLSIDEMQFLTMNSVAYRELYYTFRASFESELEQKNQRLSTRLSMLTSELDESLVETINRVSDENQHIKVSRDAWEKHCNEMANKKDAEIASLRELAREWCEAFEKSDVKVIPDLVRRTREIGQ